MALLIPEEKISEIKNHTDILEIISEVVVLKKSGKNYLGLCPFHSEKTPSFTVSPDKQIFHCFGCGVGGNVFTFITKYEGISFPDAVKTMARRYGIPLPAPAMSESQKKAFNEREALLSINRQAMEFFHKNLVDRVLGKKAMAYLAKRGISREIIDSFMLGYAADRWDNLLTYFNKKKIPVTLVEKTGLVLPRKSGSGYYDRFRNRIVFPIIDPSKLVIGFGGRVMDNSLPKYLNSPETPVYNKSRSLYGLNLAKSACRNTKTVYISEGYFDVLSLHRNSIKNAVATLGTALTSEHVRMLKGIIGKSGKVVLVYDSDSAGIKAAMRSIEIFDKEYVNARILVLPEGQDPDSYLMQYGLESFMEAADRSRTAVSFLIESAVKKHGLSIEGKIRVVDAMQVPLAALRDNLARSLYVKELAERVGIDESTVLEKIRQASAAGTNQHASRASGNENAGNEKETNGKYNRLERKIIAMMLQFPDILPEIISQRVLKYFRNDKLKSIGDLIVSNTNDLKYQPADLIDLVSDERQKQTITALSMGDEKWNMKGCMNLLTKFIENNQKNQGNILSQKIKMAEQNNNEELLFQSLEEMNIRLKELKQKQMQSRKV